MTQILRYFHRPIYIQQNAVLIATPGDAIRVVY